MTDLIQAFFPYSLAEHTSGDFGTNSNEGENSVIFEVLEALDNIKHAFLLSNACLENPWAAFNQVELAVEVMINKTKAVMVQRMHMYMSSCDVDYAELYTLQVSPLVSLCDKGMSKDLLTKLYGTQQG